jgi:hypothetical protein
MPEAPVRVAFTKWHLVGGGVLNRSSLPQAGFYRRQGTCYSCRAMLPDELTPGQKAARTRKRRLAASKAIQTKRRMSAFAKARVAEAASKEALRAYCQEHGWKIAFFEGATGLPRTGIIDAVAFRLGRKNADALDVRLIQLKGGKAGVSGREIARLKGAASLASVRWMIAAYDGEALHVLPDESEL